MMPKGVEHTPAAVLSEGPVTVQLSVMPKGVEHKDEVALQKALDQCNYQ